MGKKPPMLQRISYQKWRGEGYSHSLELEIVRPRFQHPPCSPESLLHKTFAFSHSLKLKRSVENPSWGLSPKRSWSLGDPYLPILWMRIGNRWHPSKRRSLLNTQEPSNWISLDWNKYLLFFMPILENDKFQLINIIESSFFGFSLGDLFQADSIFGPSTFFYPFPKIFLKISKNRNFEAGDIFAFNPFVKFF